MLFLYSLSRRARIVSCSFVTLETSPLTLRSMNPEFVSQERLVRKTHFAYPKVNAFQGKFIANLSAFFEQLEFLISYE